MVLLLLTVGCNQKSQEQTKSKEPQSRQQTIDVGKDPEAMFLTPDENYIYIANVEDSFISVTIRAKTGIML